MAFLVAGNYARAEDNGVAGFNVRVLVIVDGGARESGHRLALRAGDEHANFFRGKVANLPGLMSRPSGIDVAEVLRDFG
jgi:hypothetical protein